MTDQRDNTVLEEKRSQKSPLTRVDIRDVLVSLGRPGENRVLKMQIIKELCEARQDGIANPQGHPIWETLSDYPEY